MATRGFSGRPPAKGDGERLPPGQYKEEGFPVLSAGPTPRVDLASWKFTIQHGPRTIATFTWDEFQRLPQTEWKGDIHCVTKWSKFDTTWRGVTFDDLMGATGSTPPTPFLLALSYDGYDTNVPVKDLLLGQGMVATHFDGKPIEAEHGGPARLLVPHLYFWKSAKWVRGLKFTEKDEAGFWELRGYHMRGDPWKEQRYTDDP